MKEWSRYHLHQDRLMVAVCPVKYISCSTKVNSTGDADPAQTTWSVTEVIVGNALIVTVVFTVVLQSFTVTYN
jgi:hypothetical protein